MQSPAEKYKGSARPLPGEAERRARLQKMQGLRTLRSYGSCLRLDTSAQFHDLIDCTALLEPLNEGDDEQ
ncbi:hypothetical protein LB553_05095 [Mesorhizobium sp. CA8]|uniref:hypothetical protein n=1 Tax=unclassified Mesorhizobium TaxID=325217 RepID=UPI001CCD7C2A|nr:MULTISPECIES: hypothetical protein [unclassified Mesorhizobium]MBZ9760252.1 hypothetical protein [Mesorhizobium sp. CA8]MBZ9817881.1 hypothetical protein [Mesorhizobium sp. CA4]